MPQGPRGEKRPADVIGNAIMVAKIATGEIEEQLDPEQPPNPAAELGRKGGAARAKSHARAAARDRQEGCRLALEQAQMTDRQTPWWDAIGTDENFPLKVKRGAKMPMPWTWEIVGGDGKAGAQRSSRGYQSAEEAYAAGRVAIAGLGHRRAPVR
jgi:hypothetical protein